MYHNDTTTGGVRPITESSCVLCSPRALCALTNNPSFVIELFKKQALSQRNAVTSFQYIDKENTAKDSTLSASNAVLGDDLINSALKVTKKTDNDPLN